MDDIVNMITELDVPGKQVLIKATIMEIDHSNMTSLGVQLSSNPAAFGSIDEDAVTALTEMVAGSERGSFSVAVGTDITVLIDFLVKKTNAKILNEQSLWTKDNEEAEFFKGQKVAFITGTQTSQEGISTSQDFNFERVGMTLRVRPSITPEKRVDMVVNVMISQLTPDFVNSQPVRTEMDTTTNLIVEDGETIMFGGILFQQDSVIERKVPFFGDMPVLGGLFRHNEDIKANNEMLVFLTPFVIDGEDQMQAKAAEEMQDANEKLEKVQKLLDSIIAEDLNEPEQ
jgi:type II secretory pathway component GspD/PulD (secretin)